ncbi:MAG TPA: cytochrome c oxidase assembly protein [Woeseiaceae bacterium]
MVEAFGPLSAQMLLHIVAMNAAAPLLAMAVLRVSHAALARLLLPATLVQVLLLWAWHSPPAVAATLHSDLLHGGMLASLFAAALLFWTAVFACREARWRAILSLLVTGKLVCLLGVLLVFAPRTLYPGLSGGAPAALADQQLAGLLMLVACPVTYLVAGVVLAARWLGRIDAAGRLPSDSRNARQAV